MNVLAFGIVATDHLVIGIGVKKYQLLSQGGLSLRRM
jgi:hypothetical protein